MLAPYFDTKPVAHELDHNEVDAREEELVGMATNADVVESQRLSLGQLKLRTRDQMHELDAGEEMGSVPHGQALPGNRTEVESAPNRRVSRPGDGTDGDYPMNDDVDWFLEDFAPKKTHPLEEYNYHPGGYTIMDGETGGAKEMEEEGFASFLTSERSVEQGSSESDSPSPGRPATAATAMYLFKPRVNPLEIPGDEVARIAPLRLVVRACSPDVAHWRSPGGLLSPRKERARSPINEAVPSRFGVSFSTNECAPAVTGGPIVFVSKRRLVMHLDTAGEAALDALICLSVSSFLPLHGDAPGGAPPTNPWLQFLPASPQTYMDDALDTTSPTQHRAGAQPPSDLPSSIARLPPSPPNSYTLSPCSPSPLPLDAPGPPLASQASSSHPDQQAGAEEGWRGRALSPKGGLSFMQRVFGVPRSPGASPTPSPSLSPRPPGLGFGRKASEIDTSSRGERRSLSARSVRSRKSLDSDGTPPPGRLGGDGLTAADSEPHDALARDISAALAEVALGGGKEQAEAVEVVPEGRWRMKRPKLSVAGGTEEGSRSSNERSAEEAADSLEEEANNFPEASKRGLPTWQRETVARVVDRALRAEGQEGAGEGEEAGLVLEAPGISPGLLAASPEGSLDTEEGKGEPAPFSPPHAVSASSARPTGDVGRVGEEEAGEEEMEGGHARVMARDVGVAASGRAGVEEEEKREEEIKEEVVKEEVVEVRGGGGEMGGGEGVVDVEEDIKGVDPGSGGQVADREERKEMVVPGWHDASEAPTNQEPTSAEAGMTGHTDVAVSQVHVSADSESKMKAAPASEEPLPEEQGSADVADLPDSVKDRGPPNMAADISKGGFADASDEFGSPELKPPTTPPGVVVPGTQIPPLASAAEAPSCQVASAETPVDLLEEKSDQAAAPAPFPTPTALPRTPSGAVDTPLQEPPPSRQPQNPKSQPTNPPGEPPLPTISPPTTPLPSTKEVKKSRARLFIPPLFRSSRESLTQAGVEVSALSGREAQATAKALASSSTQVWRLRALPWGRNAAALRIVFKKSGELHGCSDWMQ